MAFKYPSNSVNTYCIEHNTIYCFNMQHNSSICASCVGAFISVSLYNKHKGGVQMNTKHYKFSIQVGLNLMRYRKEQGLTQEQLADMIGYSRNQIQRVETANAMPSLPLLLDVSEALEIPLGKLLEIR
jgi:DNA-binding XRE family transcriptional regulator